MSSETKTAERPRTLNGGGAAVPASLPPLSEDAHEEAGPTRLGAALSAVRRNPDLALVVALLLLTAILSRTFSKGISIGPVYVTEAVMVLAGAIAIVRLGLRDSIGALRRLPLPALILIWVVGAIATLRGLSEFGLSLVEHDVGLFDYTLLLPLLALVVVDRERFEALYATLVVCGFLGVATFLVVFTANQISGEANTLFELQGSAAGLYMSLALAWIAARLANGAPVSRWLVALAPVALVLMGLTGQRSVWMIAIAALGAVVLLAPRGRRLRSAAVVAVILPLSLAAAIGVQTVLSEVAPAESTAAIQPERVPGAAPIDMGGAETRGDENLSTTGDDGGAQLTNEITGLTDANSDEGQNIRWRLSYWEELIGRVPDAPILGVGFGQPAEFVWKGRKFDFRDGEPGTGIDVAGPHNSFVNFLYRLGIPAFLALLFIVFVAARNVWRAFRGEGLAVEDRVRLTTLVAMLAAGIVASSFNEGLTGPFLGLFFWVPLGMLLLWPAAGARKRAASATA